MNLNPPQQNNTKKLSSTTENNPTDNSRMQSNYKLSQKLPNKNIIKNEQNTLENLSLTNSPMNKNIMTITKTTNISNINNNDNNKEYIIDEEELIVPKLSEKIILKDNCNRNINYDNEPKLLSEKIIINNVGNSSESNQLISNLLENNNKIFNIHSNDTNSYEVKTIFQTLGPNITDNTNIVNNNNINNTYEINFKKNKLTDKSNESIFMTFGANNGNEKNISNNANTIEFSSIVNNNDTNKQTLNEKIKNDNIFNADSEKKKSSQNPFLFSSFSTNPFTNTNQGNINIKKKELNTEEQKNNVSPFTSIINLNNKEKKENKESNNQLLMLMLNDNPFLPPSENIPKKNPFSINTNKENKTDSNIFNNKKNENTLDIFKSEANLDIAFNNINSNSNINEYNPMEKNFINNSIKNSSIFFSNHNSQETSEKKDRINNNKDLLNKKEIVNDNFENPFKSYEIKGENNYNIFVSPINNYKKYLEENNMIETISFGVPNPKIIVDNNITNQNKIKEFNHNEHENNNKYIENFKEKKENEIEFSEIIGKKEEFPKDNNIKKETIQSNELFTLNNIIINNNENKEEIDDSNKNNKQDDLEKKNDNIMNNQENNNFEKMTNNNIEDEFKSKNILSDIIINKKDGINDRSMSQKELNNKNELPIQLFNTKLFNNIDNAKKKGENNYKDKKEKKGLFDNIFQNEQKKIQFSFLSNINNNDNKENIFNRNKGSSLFEESSINEKINNDIKEYMNNNINSITKNDNLNSFNENENGNESLRENNKEGKDKLGNEIEKKDKEEIKEFRETLEKEEENDEENNEKGGNDCKEEENNKNEKGNKQNEEILKDKKDEENLKTCEIKMNNKESEEVEDSDEEELSGEEEEYYSEKNKNNNTVSQSQNNEIINYSKRKPLKREMYSNLLEIMHNITSKRKNKINAKEKNVLTVFNNKLNADLEKLKYKIIEMKKAYIVALIKKHFEKKKNKKMEVILRANIPKRRNEVKKIFIELITFIKNKLEPYHRKYCYMQILNIITKYKNISDNEMTKNIPKIRQKINGKKIKQEKNNKKIIKNDANYNYEDKIWIVQYNSKKNFILRLFAVFLPLAYITNFIYSNFKS